MPRKILVVDHGLSYGKAIEGMGELTTDVVEFTNNPKSFSLVLFTGGADVDPSYYGETSPENYCVSHPQRDEKEALLWGEAVENKIKCAGICRGLQFLNVMNGGRMMHHIDRHEGGAFHDFETPQPMKPIRVNSLHHQMIIPGKHCHVIGWNPVRDATIYVGDRDEPVEWPGPEIEAAYWPRTGNAGVQYHPEMMDRQSDGWKWFYEMVEDLLIMTSETFTEKYVRGCQRVSTRGTV